MDEGDEYYEYYDAMESSDAVEQETMIRIQFDELYNDIKNCKCITFANHPLSGLPAIRLVFSDDAFGFEI